MSSVNLTSIRSSTTPLAQDASPDVLEGVNWRAVIAGAVAATALSFILLLLGVGLGLSATSPWSFEGIGAAPLAVSAIVWVILTQIAASGLGGYMAGRLRGRWLTLRDPEVYFRDTAHGLLAWGLSTLIMAGLMGAAVSGVVNQAAQATGSAATLAQTAVNGSAQPEGAPAGAAIQAPVDANAYWIDVMMRADPQAVAQGQAITVVDPATDAATRAQATRILGHAVVTGTLSTEDSQILAQQVSLRTGMPLAPAQARVNDTYARVLQSLSENEAAIKEKADAARKASAHATLWMFVALLAGAFVAAWLATYGGRQRDRAAISADAGRF